jgi:zinc D-Ala-D-Ala carboxypeptidase
MKNIRIRIMVIFCALAVVAGVASLAARDGRGQSQKLKKESQPQTPERESRVKRTVLLPTVNSAAKSNSPAFAEAAAQNAVLRNELVWLFGSKQQHGWYLYDLLIGQTLNVPSDASTSDLASAIAAWQKQKGLNANGILDEGSLMALVGQWQANRLKDKTPAMADQLVMAPPSDFYDPSRLPELRQVERNTYAAYKQMIAAAVADPSLHLTHTTSGELAATEKYFKIVSGFRSREYQEQLRRQSPNAGSAGLAVNSPHFTGHALDLYVGGDPVDTKDANRAIQVNTPAYQWLVRNAARFGFRPYFYEPWHWEYVD